MIKILIGDMFQSKAQTLVNTVNCVGVMGTGVALEFKKRYPDYYADYRQRCSQGKVKLGFPYLYKRLDHPWILSFPTKDHWRSMTKLSDIIAGLEWLLEHYREWRIESLAIPPLGTGHGQLEWRIIGRTLYSYLCRMSIPVELYAPYGIPQTEIQPEFLEKTTGLPGEKPPAPSPQWIKPSWAAIVEILRRIEEQPYTKPVGRTVFQKIAYLATEEGLPTGLEFKKSSFGPFSGELKLVMTRLLNNGLIEECRVGNMYRVVVGQTYEDARRAYAKDLEEWISIIDRVVDLFMRTKMDTSTAEIATAIIFAARRLREVQGGKLSEVDVFNAVTEWKRRRRPQLDRSQIAYMIRVLAGLGWISTSPSLELQMPSAEYSLA